MPTSPRSASPIGVFDSGIGGISVLRALRVELPHERFVYLADAGFAPYGERSDAYLLARARAIAHYLVERHSIKALVVACNTATAAAIQELRHIYPNMLIIGIEPALKPALAVTKTRLIGVMATRGTLKSEKFGNLLKSMQGAARFVLQPCDGLADAIEHGDSIKIEALSTQYTSTMGTFGLNDGEIDTLVLGCTHYPFIANQLIAKVGAQVAHVDGGAPVARHTRRMLAEQQSLSNAPIGTGVQQRLAEFLTTGSAKSLGNAARRWMSDDAGAQAVQIPCLQIARGINC